MKTITLWANLQCGTCQKVSDALKKKGYLVKVIEYLKTPPSIEDIDDVCLKLGLEPQAVARQKEDGYNEASKQCKTRRDWLRALHENPRLIQRPIVILENKAIIARPPERLEELL